MPNRGDQVSFEHDIKPLFRPKDVKSMKPFGFDLSKYEDVKARANRIYQRLKEKAMPCDGAWPDADIAKFKQWIDETMKP